MLLPEIIKKLQAPTPANEVKWVLTSENKKDPTKNMWTAYVSGDYMRQTILELCPLHDVYILEQWIDGTCKMLRVSITLHGDDGQQVTIQGIGGADSRRNVSEEKRWKAAKTTALKNAMLELGFGLDIHGQRKWGKTKPTTQARAQANRARKPAASPPAADPTTGEIIENGTDITPTQFWTKIKEHNIDQDRARKVLELHNGHRGNSLALLIIQAPAKS